MNRDHIVDNPMTLRQYTLLPDRGIDEDYPEIDRFEEVMAERLNRENFARAVRNRQEENPDIDSYEEMQIERYGRINNESS